MATPGKRKTAQEIFNEEKARMMQELAAEKDKLEKMTPEERAAYEQSRNERSEAFRKNVVNPDNETAAENSRKPFGSGRE